MKKQIFFITFFFFNSGFLLSQSLAGNWSLDLNWTDYSQFRPGSSNSANSIITIQNVLEGSNDFIGKFIHDGKEYGLIKGRLIEASTPYKRDLIVFERIDKDQDYIAVYSCHLNGDKMENGHMIDSFGNSGTFTMTKR